MYEKFELIVTIAFFALAGIAIVSALVKKNKQKKKDDENS